MSPHPTWSHLDYCGGGEGYYAFEREDEDTLELFVGENQIPEFHARIDTLHRRLTYENAMAHPAVLVRPNSARVFHLHTDGRIRVEPGDVLASFTGEIGELAVVRVIRENPTDRAAALVSRILELSRGTIVAARFISTEVPALAEESADLTLAVA